MVHFMTQQTDEVMYNRFFFFFLAEWLFVFAFSEKMSDYITKCLPTFFFWGVGLSKM